MRKINVKILEFHKSSGHLEVEVDGIPHTRILVPVPIINGKPMLEDGFKNYLTQTLYQSIKDGINRQDVDISDAKNLVGKKINITKEFWEQDDLLEEDAANRMVQEVKEVEI